MDFIWLIPLVPGIGAALNGLVGVRAFSKRTAGLLATGAMAVAFLLSCIAFVQLLGSAERYHKVTVASWIPPIPLETADGMGAFEVPWAFTLDPLSGMMLLVVTGIGLLIHIYSIGYIDHEPRGGVARFFCYLNLFCFFMLILVLGSSFLVMFVGWEGVGLCSYLLIGYWYKKKSASDAGKKAFIVNRIGDWGFILGIFLVFFTFGTLDFREVAEAAAAMPVETAAIGFGVISGICLLLFIGATGKSAQIPLYVWLPDAMEGPTPVSALIHAATHGDGRRLHGVPQRRAVHARAHGDGGCRGRRRGHGADGGHHRPGADRHQARAGLLHGVAARLHVPGHRRRRLRRRGVPPDDARLLQGAALPRQRLGHPRDERGAGHAAHGRAAQAHAADVRHDAHRRGGHRRHPPLSGFFSKDEILYKTFLHSPLLWGIGAITAVMTAFYMFRLINMTFFGEYRGPAPDAAGHGGGHDDGHGHAWHGPHESPRLMTWPLVALAVGAVLAGFVGVPAALGGSNMIEHFLEPSFTAGAAAHAGEEVHHYEIEWALMALSVLLALGAIWFARAQLHRAAAGGRAGWPSGSPARTVC